MVALTWKNIHIVSLAWCKELPVTEFHWLKWTATGKQTPSLLRNEITSICNLMWTKIEVNQNKIKSCTKKDQCITCEQA